MRAIELFAGAGGMALGVSRAGFHHEAVIEWDKHACNTVRENQWVGVKPIVDWKLFETDVRDFDFSGVPEGVDLLAGGPPCQPFSIGGKHAGYNDARDMFPTLVDAVRSLRPRAVLVENVRGLLRESFARYFEYILLQLSYPEVGRKATESWDEHQSRLEQHHTCGRGEGLVYRPVFRLLNAADFGVPQKRERVMIVALRADQGKEWSFPNPTHSLDALLWDQWVSGAYWERHKVRRKLIPQIPSYHATRVRHLGESLIAPRGLPWQTVRDAISGLPEPSDSETSASVLNHRLQSGARAYIGHTGSPLDEPAKTLKAGDHGVPGGENMLALVDGTVRYFTVRESARLQTFPDVFLFPGSWTESMRQLGNAVPVRLAEVIATNLRNVLSENGN